MTCFSGRLCKSMKIRNYVIILDSVVSNIFLAVICSFKYNFLGSNWFGLARTFLTMQDLHAAE